MELSVNFGFNGYLLCLEVGVRCLLFNDTECAILINIKKTKEYNFIIHVQ